MDWTFLRNPAPGSWSLSERPGHLVLRGSGTHFDDAGAPAFVGRRLSHFRCRIAARLDFEPAAEGEEAGLTVFMNEKYHYDLLVRRVREGKAVVLRKRVALLWPSRRCPAGRGRSS